MTEQISRPKPGTPTNELPVELEQIIFSLALHNDWKHFIDLILVAKRVYHWLIPQIYETVLLHFIKIEERYLSSYGLILHGKHVRHLMLSNVKGSVEHGLYHPSSYCLSLCPNITRLALFLVDSEYDIELINQLVNLRHLTHLSFDFRALIDGLASKEQPLPDPFTTVTHLDVITTQTRHQPEDIHQLFPALTHLAFVGDEFTPTSVLKRIFELYKDQLEVVVLYMPGYPAGARHVVPDPHRADPRAVVLRREWDVCIDDWFQDSVGGSGLWAVADEAVKDWRAGA